MPDAGATACLLCGVGKYSDRDAATSNATCTACPVATYAPVAGGGSLAGACLPCGLGTFGTETGQSACRLCPAGTYADSEGKSSCDACVDGTYASDQGNAFCAPCPLGTSTARG